jgi:Xaa-Pro aminopeptidase
MRRHICWSATAVVLCLALGGGVEQLGAERLGYPPAEFPARRKALADQLGKGLVLMFGTTMPTIAARPRQDNDFYYLTGNPDLNAVLVMDVATAGAHLFLPKQSAREIRADGKNWLEDPGSAEKWGFASIEPLSALSEFLARRLGGSGSETVWVRLSERDEVSQSRSTKALNHARRSTNPLGSQPSEDAWRIEALRQRYPFVELKDMTPVVDRMRMIKTPREIEILKENGRIAAEAHVRAIAATRPGMFEYEVEAEATYHMIRNGVQGAGYAAIVGSGPNVNTLHYRDSGRRIVEGDLIVMDYGGSLDYLVIDITRTWPASGKFDDLQLRAYRCALEVQKAIISMMRPGNTRAAIRQAVRPIYEKHGFADQNTASAGHFVGMSVHDVGDSTLPFAPGMVIAVEPMIDIPDKHLHIRIEDTVLITDGDPVVLTAAAPKEVDDLLALMAAGRKTTPEGLGNRPSRGGKPAR